jgi:ATP adenylyltransferase
MDYLWTPWRFAYIEEVTKGKPPDCLFCDALAQNRDEETLIVYRGNKAFIILNRFPYTSGHVMLVPYQHVPDLAGCDPEALGEIMFFSQRLDAIFRKEYKPDGANLGMNLGRAAGAGVAGHIHLHMLPRWFGDTNFMTVAGETRVHPEELRTTYKRLRAAFSA